MTTSDLQALETFVNDAYRQHFRKLCTPEIGALISQAVETIRHQQGLLDDARVFAQGVKNGWHRSRVIQILKLNLERAEELLEKLEQKP